MTWRDVLDRVVLRLVDAGYDNLGAQVQVASIPYEFDRVLLGPAQTLDLVLVVDTTTAAPERLCQKIDGLGRALDMAHSRRTVTAVLVGPQPDPDVLASIRGTCRYLLIPTDDSELGDLLEDRLAILLPLELSTSDDEVSDPMRELRKRLPAFANDDERAALLEAAAIDAASVTDELKKYLERPLLEDR